jgi:hypothetical protein
MKLPQTTIDTLAPYVDRRDLEAMRLTTSPALIWFPRLWGMSATTFWRFVAIRADRYDASPRCLALIAHEALHIAQAREMHYPVFLLRYAIGQFQCRFHHDAHPLEVPAIALQARVRAALGG